MEEERIYDKLLSSTRLHGEATGTIQVGTGLAPFRSMFHAIDFPVEDVAHLREMHLQPIWPCGHQQQRETAVTRTIGGLHIGSLQTGEALPFIEPDASHSPFVLWRFHFQNHRQSGKTVKEGLHGLGSPPLPTKGRENSKMFHIDKIPEIPDTDKAFAKR